MVTLGAAFYAVLAILSKVIKKPFVKLVVLTIPVLLILAILVLVVLLRKRREILKVLPPDINEDITKDEV